MKAKHRDELIIAFVQGALWWEYHETGATMWSSDQRLAEDEAEARLAEGSLGKFELGENVKHPNKP